MKGRSRLEMNTTPQVVGPSLLLVKSDIPSQQTTVAAEPESEHFTDVGNAERLVQCHGEDLRFCHPWNSWLVWDRVRWMKDEKGAVIRRAKETIQSIYIEAHEAPTQSNREALAKHAVRSESAGRVNAMINLAASEIPILPDELDRDPWLLNLKNGTLDLRGGELGSHQRAHMITKLAPVDYDSDAACPQWEKFLKRILPDPEIRRFLQRAVGSALTGVARDKSMFILWGSGDNGKTVFIETIRDLLGDYAINAPVETFLAKKQSGIPNDVARLRGARFVSAQESDQGRRLNEALVKAMTGGDTLTARFLHAEFFEFLPEFKPFLSTNHKPIVRGTDHGIWSRIKLIPFTVKIPGDEQDKGLREKLRDEYPGILKWAFEGCREWQEHGLGEPAVIRDATDSYRQEMDCLKHFLSECCVEGAEAKTLLKDMYSAYRRWAESNGEHPAGKSTLSSQLKERGFDCRKSTGNQVYVFCLRLNPVS